MGDSTVYLSYKNKIHALLALQRYTVESPITDLLYIYKDT